MKTRALRSYLCFTLLATAFLLGLAGCDKEESEPLRIGDDSFNNIENGVWTAYYPNTNQTSITIYGGVKPYTVSSNSDILKVNMDKLSDAFNYETLGVGDAEVTITDAKGESVGLKVKIDYRSDKMKIVKLDAYVKGDKMTVAAQKELKEKALASIPVKQEAVISLYIQRIKGELYMSIRINTVRNIKKGLSPVVLLRLGIVHIGNMK